MPTLNGPRASWRHVLRRHLTLVLLLKIAALASLWALFFRDASRMPVDAAAVARALLPARPHQPPRQIAPRPVVAEEGAHD